MKSRPVHVIGGGFSGMVTAYYLARQGANVHLHERQNRLGGLLGSSKNSWGLVEHAANGFLASDELFRFCDEIGVALTPAKGDQRRRYIFREEPRQLPLSPLEFTRFSVGLVRKGRPPQGVVAKDWCQSKFGYGACDYLIEPMMMGIFGTDLSNLSAQLLYDYFFSYKAKRSRRSWSGLCSPAGGMQEFLNVLERALVNSGVHISKESTYTPDPNDKIVLAVPAHVAADILDTRDEWLAAQLRKVRYLPLTSVTLGFRSPKFVLPGFGCLFPRKEKFNSLGVLFNNFIFENRGPLHTETFIFSASDLSENELIEKSLADRGHLHSLSDQGDEASESEVHVWQQALPCYDIQLEKVLESFYEPSHTYFVGNYLGRIGLTKILEHCKSVADKVVST